MKMIIKEWLNNKSYVLLVVLVQYDRKKEEKCKKICKMKMNGSKLIKSILNYHLSSKVLQQYDNAMQCQMLRQHLDASLHHAPCTEVFVFLGHSGKVTAGEPYKNPFGKGFVH